MIRLCLDIFDEKFYKMFFDKWYWGTVPMDIRFASCASFPYSYIRFLCVSHPARHFSPPPFFLPHAVLHIIALLAELWKPPRSPSIPFVLFPFRPTKGTKRMRRIFHYFEIKAISNMSWRFINFAKCRVCVLWLKRFPFRISLTLNFRRKSFPIAEEIGYHINV